MRYDSEHKQRTRERVLAEAANAIRESGPDKVSVAALMSKAGLTHGGFYAHFANKDELVDQAIDTMFADRLVLLHNALAASDPQSGLKEYIDLYLSPLHRDHRDKGCPIVALASDMARLPKASKLRFEAGIQAMTTALSRLLERLCLEQTDQLASTTLMEMVGAMSMARAMASKSKSDAILSTARQSIYIKLGLTQSNLKTK